MEAAEEAQSAINSSSKGPSKHRLSVEVNNDVWRVVLPRGSTIGDLTQAVQKRLCKSHKTGGELVPVVTELLERRTTDGNADGGGNVSGHSGTSVALKLDADKAISDLADSDSEGRTTFVAVLRDEGSVKTCTDTNPVSANVEQDEEQKSPAYECGSTIHAAKTSSTPATAKEKASAGVPHKICYTVAGMPRPMKEGNLSIGGVNRGPRKGTVTALTTWNLRDLKQAIAGAEGVPFTPDAGVPSTEQAKLMAKIGVNITVSISSNIKVSINLGLLNTVEDLWRVVACAVSGADRAATEAGGSGGSGSSGSDMEAFADTLAAMNVAAAAAAVAASDRLRSEGSAMDEGDENSGVADGDVDRGNSNHKLCLPQGHVLMRKVVEADKDCQDVKSKGSQLRFLWFSGDTVGPEGCDLRNGEELVLVGASGISADVIPYWMVQVLVLGQPTGYVCIPNRHLEGTAVPPAESGSGAAVKDPAETGKREAEDTEEGLASTDSGLRTLGDLRAHIGDKLDLATDEVELWIADPEDRSSDTFSSTRGDGNLKGHTGHGNSPAHPRGDKALIDDMDLRYYGLHHLSVVDVRIKPKARENGSSGSEAAGTEGGGAGEKNKEGQGDIVRIGVKTSHMMARGEEGTEMFVSTSSFGIELTEILASRALKVPRKSVAQVAFIEKHSTFVDYLDSWRVGRRYSWRNGRGQRIGSIYPIKESTTMIVRIASLAEKESDHTTDASGSTRNSLEDESTLPVGRTSMALWLEEPSENGVDPIGVSSTPLSATVYSLRSTFESDGVGLREWGLLRENVHVYAVFYRTRSVVSASEYSHAKNEYTVGREDNLSSALCWQSRPVFSSSKPDAGDDAGSENDGPGSAHDHVEGGDLSEGGDSNEGDDSKEGLACFLSCIYVLSVHLPVLQGDGEEGTIGWVMRELVSLMSPSFPPAALALHQLLENDGVTEAECACLIQCLWGIARLVIPRKVEDRRVLEHSNTLLAWLVSRATTARDYAQREGARQASIKKAVEATAAAAAAAMPPNVNEGSTSPKNGKDEISSSPKDDTDETSQTFRDETNYFSSGVPRMGTKVENIELVCPIVMDHLLPGHAVHLIINGELLDGAYSSGGAVLRQHRHLQNTLRDYGRGSEERVREPPTFEVVPWEAGDRLLVAGSFWTDLVVLRYTYPNDRNSSSLAPEMGADASSTEDATSWLSLVDWKSCVRRASEQTWSRVITPLSLGRAECPCLTRDRDGRLCVYTGRSKGVASTLKLFSPLEGKETDEDPHGLAQAVDRIAKSKRGLSGGGFEEAESSARVARELVVVCMDSSYSMGRPSDFEEDHFSDAEDEKQQVATNTLVFDWSTPSPKLSGESFRTDDTELPNLMCDGVCEVLSDDESSDWGKAEDSQEREDEDGKEETRKEILMDALLRHACLKQLQEVAIVLDQRFGRWSSPKCVSKGSIAYSEMVLEELVLENYNPNSQQSKADATLNAKVYRRYRDEFMDILLEKGNTADDISRWAPRQFICPITQGLMADPAVAVDGHSYERHAILEWFSACTSSGRSPSSPLTGEELVSGDVTSNLTLKSSIQEWVLGGGSKGARRAFSAGGGGGGDSTSPSRESPSLNIKVKVCYGDKEYDVTVNRASGTSGVQQLQAFVLRTKAMPSHTAVPVAGDGSNAGSVGGSGGGAGGAFENDNGSDIVTTWSGSENESESGSESESGIGSENESGSEDGSENDSESEYENENDSGSEIKSGSDNGSENDSESEYENESEIGSENEGESGSDYESESENGSDSGSGSGSGSAGERTGGGSRGRGVLISPSTIRLTHNGNCLKSTLMDLKEGDLVQALDVKIPPHSSFTVKMQAWAERPVFLLARRGETGFSIKLRFWMQRESRRPSTSSLWHDLKPATDGVRLGTSLSNVSCIPPPKNSDSSSAETATAGEASEKPTDDICIIDVFRRDPYKVTSDARPSLTRLDAVKQLFHAYINRTQAYDLPVEVGLVSFGSEVKVACEPTPLLENFRDQVDVLSNSGDTRLWDALQMAHALIKTWKSSWRSKAEKRQAAEHHRKGDAARGKSDEGNQSNVPSGSDDQMPILRLLVLSDGEDTKSEASAHLICNQLQEEGVLVDSVTVGKETNDALKCLSLATGGYAFHPTSLRQALRLSELETVLSAGQRARQGIKARGMDSTDPLTQLVSTEEQLLCEARMKKAHDTEETATLKEDPRVKSTCRPLVAALAGISPTDNTSTSSSAGDGSSGEALSKRGNAGSGVVHRERTRRVQREMMSMIRNPHQAFEVLPSDEDVCFWKAILTGPESTPYEGGCWMICIYFPPSYPSIAPEIRFITPIQHCNINSHGRVCHSLLDRSWTPNTSVSSILSCVYGLLLYPDHDDPLDSTLTLQMYDSNGEYEASIVEHVKAHASKPRKVWMAELEAEGMSAEERVAPCLKTLTHAQEALKLGRLAEARLEAWVASVLAAGGPAPITVAPFVSKGYSEAQLPVLKVASASACMVVAWAALKEPNPKLEEAEGIAANARRHNGKSPDIHACLAKVAELRWKRCIPGSELGIARLRETIMLQIMYLRMTDTKSAAREEARQRLDALQTELERLTPSNAPSAVQDDPKGRHFVG